MTIMKILQTLKAGEIVKFNGVSVQCTNNDERFDETQCNVENLLTLEAMDEDLRVKVKIHLYHAKQELTIQGTTFQKFLDSFLQPLIEMKIALDRDDIDKANRVFKFAATRKVKDIPANDEKKEEENTKAECTVPMGRLP